ncbi:MAG TPA: TetR/AcrR family transcriptional regulator [Gemmatimonadales bacterium]|nr:TetR/AcrR family transcriptional regulator [Gemmatimonadales bacterium]
MTAPLSPPSGPPTPPPKRDGEATRARLLRSALDLFTTAGFRATTTTAIAEGAAVAEGTIYRHFSGKEELFNELYRQAQLWAGKLAREVDAERGITTPERLRRLGQAMIDDAARDPALARMFLTRGDERYQDEKSKETAREFREILQHIMASGKSDGLVRPGPAELWAGVWLALVSYAMWRVSAGEWAPDHPQTTLTLEAAWDAIAVRPGAAPAAKI